jgi:hypothetical protein
MARWRESLDWLVERYQAAGIAGQRKLACRITINPDGDGPNGTKTFLANAEKTMAGCQYAWSKRPNITMPAIFDTGDGLPELTKFHRMREELG